MSHLLSCGCGDFTKITNQQLRSWRRVPPSGMTLEPTFVNFENLSKGNGSACLLTLSSWKGGQGGKALHAATNRNEQMRNSLATQRSLCVHAPHSTAKGSRRTKELRGNASMTAGLAGQRKRKLEGGGEEHETLNQKKIQPTMSGAYQTSEILKETLNSHQASKGISAEDRKEI
jgi:hypothetical protein